MINNELVIKVFEGLKKYYEIPFLEKEENGDLIMRTIELTYDTIQKGGKK